MGSKTGPDAGSGSLLALTSLSLPAPGAAGYPVDKEGSMPQPRILILEHYLPTGQALAFILQRAGWEVTLSQTDRDTLEALRHNVFDVLLVDLEITTGDGWRVLQRLGSDRSPIPIIVMLDRESQQYQHAQSLGASVVLAKPVQRKRLLASATAVLADVG
jgi:two-component system response regulator RegX3